MKRFLIIACSFFLTNLAFAFRISPMSMSLGPEKLFEYVVVENEPNSGQLALEITPTLRQVDLQGKEERPATELIRVFPSQFLLKPGEKRRVKVTYTGAQDTTREIAFRLVAEQLAVDGQKNNQKNQSGINILLKYVAAVYFTPLNSEPLLEVKKIQQQGDKKLLVQLENKGNAHIILKNPRLQLSRANSNLATLETQQLKSLVGENILAGAVREFILEWKHKPVSELKAILLDQ